MENIFLITLENYVPIHAEAFIRLVCRSKPEESSLEEAVREKRRKKSRE